MPNYAIGAMDPKISSDVGSGKWCSEPQTAKVLVYKRMIELALATKLGNLVAGENATRHLEHFFNNTGSTLKIDLQHIIDSEKYLKELYEVELDLAKSFSQSLGSGHHYITSKTGQQGYFKKMDGKNMFYAIGGFSYWGKGVVDIRSIGKLRKYILNFEFKLFDRYNWDKDKKFGFKDIDDNFMQKFHKQCYAREFDVIGRYKKTYWWNA